MVYLEYEMYKTKYLDLQCQFDIALTEKEKLLEYDESLNTLRQLLEDRKLLLEMKETELRKSQDRYDKIYVYRFVDGYGINKVARTLNYSKSQVYRILDQIQKRCDKMRKETC